MAPFQLGRQPWNLVLEGKDVNLVGPEAAEQQSALRGISPLLAGVGWKLGASSLASILHGLAAGWGPVAGRERKVGVCLAPPLQCLGSTCRVENARH